MNNLMARNALFGSIWQRLRASRATANRATFAITDNWNSCGYAWLLRAKQDSALGGASMEVAIIGPSLLLRLPTESCGAGCPWVYADYEILEQTDSGKTTTFLCKVSCSDGADLSFRLYVFAGSRELEIVELDTRERPRLLKIIRGIRWTSR